MPHALIFGIAGQDGAYLSELLLARGYRVTGTSRDAQVSAFANFDRLGIRDRVDVTSMAINDFRSVLQVITRVAPDEVYNLAGQSSVSLSFEQPAETLESIAIGGLNVLEAIRIANPAIRLYNAGSGECFGDTGGAPATEQTPFRPRSPYAVAKSAAFWQVANYRDTYGLFACSGILFNHESPLRPERFVTQKIVRAARRIAAGSNERLALGDLGIQRDWGWAPEYVDAMWRMLQQPAPRDLIIATGDTQPLSAFVEQAFDEAGLDWRGHVDSSPAFMRPGEQRISRADPSQAQATLGWVASTRLEAVARRMVREADEAQVRRTSLPTSPLPGR
jgi:GDPmannose 4,6-dehydratase